MYSFLYAEAVYADACVRSCTQRPIVHAEAYCPRSGLLFTQTLIFHAEVYCPRRDLLSTQRLIVHAYRPRRGLLSTPIVHGEAYYGHSNQFGDICFCVVNVRFYILRYLTDTRDTLIF